MQPQFSQHSSQPTANQNFQAESCSNGDNVPMTHSDSAENHHPQPNQASIPMAQALADEFRINLTNNLTKSIQSNPSEALNNIYSMFSQGAPNGNSNMQ